MQIRVVDKAVIPVVLICDPTIEFVCKRSGESTEDGHAIVVFCVDTEFHLCRITRRACTDIDEAGQRICAVASSLRTAKNFDLIDVEQSECRCRVRKIDTVH